MALGSSAPEILLSIIEIVGNNFRAGELGPGTIVGSAAFNLYIIIAICISAIPAPEFRRIEKITVFWVTVFWSLFAYVWLFLIISVITPGVIDLWEGTLTFLFFPLTVLTSYIVDKGYLTRCILTYCSCCLGGKRSLFGKKIHPAGKDPVAPDALDFENHRKLYLECFAELRHRYPKADIPTVLQLAEKEVIKRGPKSRAFYRVQATRRLMGYGDPINKIPKLRHMSSKTGNKKEKDEEDTTDHPHGSIDLFFDPSHYTCLENVGTMYVVLVCKRTNVKTKCSVSVSYYTKDGTAKAGPDYIATEGTVSFSPEESKKCIGIDIVDNDLFEEDEHFFVNLENARCQSDGGQDLPHVELTTPFVATVMIVDNDHAGSFEFDSEKQQVTENVGVVKLKVIRCRGSRGAVSIPFRTIDATARAGRDYKRNEGLLKFSDDSTERYISVDIHNSEQYEKGVHFVVELGDPIWEISNDGEELTEEEKKLAEEGKPVLGDVKKCQVVITECKEFKGFIDKMLQSANSSLVLGSSSVKQELKEAITLGEDSASTLSRVMHYLSMPWKILFALVPPTEYFGGWACFVVSIIVIGVMTMFIGDLASHFGCTVGLKPSVTAITIVALGTSLPDTFASRTAALHDSHADSSIINVTGSNAVNVYLGIGVAWMVAAIYHKAKGSEFTVNAGSLAFSVTLFSIGAVFCIAILQFRRYFPRIGAELGGPQFWKIFSSLIFITVWLIYILLSSLEAYCHIQGF